MPSETSIFLIAMSVVAAGAGSVVATAGGGAGSGTGALATGAAAGGALVVDCLSPQATKNRDSAATLSRWGVFFFIGFSSRQKVKKR